MADEGGSSIQISDITKCSICLEIYKEPKVLPCIHTFCRQCLQNSFHDKDPGDEAACPLCRKVFSVPVGGVQNIQTNFFMNQLLQVTQSMHWSSLAKSDSTPVCELCTDSASATAFRFECQQSICDKCAVSHTKIRTTMSHKVVPFKSMTNVDERMKLVLHYCEEHPEKQIELYCYDCKVTTCLMCYVTNHNTHKCCDVKKAGEEFSALLTNDIETVAACALRSKKKLEQIEGNKNKFLQEVADTEAQIKQKYDEFVTLLQSKIKRLMEELHSFRDKRLKEIANDKDDVERELVTREGFNIYCREIKDKGTACDISREGSSLHARAEEFVNARDTSVISDQCGEGPIITFEPSFMTSDQHILNWIGELYFRDGDVRCDTLKHDFQATAFLDQPKLLHMIDENEIVYGLTVLGDEVFVYATSSNDFEVSESETTEESEVEDENESVLDVYNFISFSLIHQLTLPDIDSIEAITACPSINCLYILSSDNIVYRYDLFSKTVVIKWSLDDICVGLSITRSGTILTISQETNRIRKYTLDGSLLEEICLDMNMDQPFHCMQVSNDLFVVSHGDGVSKQSGVSIIDEHGRAVKTYGGPSGHGVGQMNSPRYMAVDEYDNIIVTDTYNNRIEILSSTLTHLGYVQVPGHKLNRSCDLHLDELHRRLYIGELGGRRMFVLEAGVQRDCEKTKNETEGKLNDGISPSPLSPEQSSKSTD